MEAATAFDEPLGALQAEGGLALLAVGVWASSLLAGSWGAGGAPRKLADQPSEPNLQVAGLRECRLIALRYLPVYALGTLGDWMQGGHLYALYQSYDYSIAHIAHIFAVGYTSAALLGTYAAAFGDRYGYRLCVVLYGLCYSLECASMNYRSTPVLLAGRVCGGVAYSLLYVSFESWLVAEGQARALPGEYMGHLFATATTVNALSAVVGGALAHATLELGRAGAEAAGRSVYVSPFNAATLPLLGCSLLAAVAWRERFSRLGEPQAGEEERLVSREPSADGAAARGWGRDAEAAAPPMGAAAAHGCAPARGGAGPAGPGERDGGGSITASLLVSVRRLRREPCLLQLGLLSSLYEATLYAFVFLWTPALQSRAAGGAGGRSAGAQIAHGKIFSLLMLFKAAGSRVFATGLAGAQGGQRAFALRALKLTFGVSAACLLVPVVSARYDVTLCAFCAFEMMLGFYWPAAAMLRSEFVTEGRSSMMSVFRVLLNCLVILLLELSGALSESAMFLVACAMLLASWASAALLEARVQGTAALPTLAALAKPKPSRSDDLNQEDDREDEERAAPAKADLLEP